MLAIFFYFFRAKLCLTLQSLYRIMVCNYSDAVCSPQLEQTFVEPGSDGNRTIRDFRVLLAKCFTYYLYHVFRSSLNQFHPLSAPTYLNFWRVRARPVTKTGRSSTGGRRRRGRADGPSRKLQTGDDRHKALVYLGSIVY